MRRARRRRWNAFWLVVATATIGAVAGVAALVGDTERIGNYWLHAALDDEGGAQVVEVIDYDFGPNARRGILRDIPGVEVTAEIGVMSPTAPDDVTVTGGAGEIRLRIGDPAVTVRGRHRYRIEYPITTLHDRGRISWNVVGEGWTVGVDQVEGHLSAPWALADLRCHRGRLGDRGGCVVRELEPGHLVVEEAGLDAGEAITIEATAAGELASLPDPPVEPTGPAHDPGTGAWPPGVAAAALGLVGAFGVSAWARHLGREQVWVGGPADAAFGPRAGEDRATRRVDDDELAAMATIEFEPPRDVAASTGGIIADEKVKSRHLIAWLIECAIRDEVILETTGPAGSDVSLVRGPAPPHPDVADQLDTIFGDRTRIELGQYDQEFAAAWEHLRRHLEDWQRSSDLWDHAGRRRMKQFAVGGSLALLIGLAGAVIGGIAANRAGASWLWLPALGGLVGAGGLAGLVRAWELPVRSAAGSALWIRVESFRRFIAASEASHAESAARMGLLRHYTAWAVALDELDHWEDAVDKAAATPGSLVAGSHDLPFVALAPQFSSAASASFTAPSSSSGGGGGGAGGGGGGGGGGSW